MRERCPTKNLEVILVISRPRTWDGNVQRTVRCSVDSRLINRASPSSCLPDVTHVTFSQAFPSVFAYCKRSKTGDGVERGYDGGCLTTESVVAANQLPMCHRVWW